MGVRRCIFGLGGALLCASTATAQTTRILQTRFEQEQDVIRRARMMTEMSRADFHSVSEQVAAGDNTDALKTLQQFVDDAKSCSDTLDTKESNPESHPAGFKQLQIATRESLERLDDLMVGLAVDEQMPFQAIRKNLDQLNRHLIRELFPHEPQPLDSPAPAAPVQPGVKP
jgi:hypothetical protein